MLTALLTLVGVVLGVALSGIGLETYKRHRDKQGTASALAGEIFSVLQMSARRNYVPWFTQMVRTLESGTDVKIPNIVQPGGWNLDPVVNAQLSQIGHLGEQVPERVVTFYRYLTGIRGDLIRLAEGQFDNDLRQKAGIIREDLALWGETVQLGTSLVKELRTIAAQPWWLPRCWVTVKGLLSRKPKN